jgi:battenin
VSLPHNDFPPDLKSIQRIAFRQQIPKADREASMGIATMADSIGIALAGWLSMPVHNAICHLPKPMRLGS